MQNYKKYAKDKFNAKLLKIHPKVPVSNPSDTKFELFIAVKCTDMILPINHHQFHLLERFGPLTRAEIQGKKERGQQGNFKKSWLFIFFFIYLIIQLEL